MEEPVKCGASENRGAYNRSTSNKYGGKKKKNGAMVAQFLSCNG